ncbi:TonB-dependent receptor [Stenotrophomonas sp. HMWF022]|uniref:TonB-dependent receptor domain-containing protein n=1 Tax=Stenotrophomonas sp. HMWF023 TaxID=2056859 RepID=UPI000D3C790C|nr:TonB-dependent receptor [Stenotrophomonas sp. HMWF023]PTS72467.1 TonB-dependent receptor [Stenotrophomonas sp. HMWF023]PTT55565.1 TonB-dependent receptor [Stenotrophomonas sp. HMWF022]
MIRFPDAGRLSCAVLLALAPPLAVAAAAPSQLDPVVVTATATDRLASDAPASISVITREQIQLRPVLDLADALRGSPGVTVAGVGFGRRGIRIRGMDPGYTLVLLDGQRVSASADAIAHSDFDLGWLPAAAIERIEVVRGPMSSLYGSEALGGVVNVISRRATDEWQGNLIYNGGVVAGDRGGNSTQTGLYAGGALVPGVLGLSVFAEHRQKDATRDPTDERLDEQEARRANTGRAVLTWTPDARQRIDLSHLQGNEQRRRHALQAGTAPYVYETLDDIQRRQTTLSHQGDWAWGQTRVSAYRAELDRDNRRDRGEASRPQQLTDQIVDARATVSLGTHHRVSVGGEWRRQELDDASGARSGHLQADQTAVFVQDEIQLNDGLSLVVGNRSDRHPEFGWHHSPRAYAVWHANEAFTIKGGIGTGFKAPSLKQLSPEYSAVGGGGRFTIVGNPQLKPEQNSSAELSAAWQRDRWSLQATAFQNDLKDLIQTTCVRACGVRGRELRNYTNVARARIRGIELAATAPISEHLTAEANWSWLDPRDRQTDRWLLERPRRSGAAALNWQRGPLQAAVRGEYIGPQQQAAGTAQITLPGYWLWSLDARWRVTGTVSVLAGVDNLANKRLDETGALYPYPETGRYVHAGIELGF